MHHSLITLKNISVAYGEKIILRDISCAICRGQIISFIGACGSGKTTLLKLLCGLLSPERGWIITGENIIFPGLRIANIDQNPGLQVFKNFVYEEFPNLNKDEVMKLLEKNNCAYLCEKRCLELSQGEKTIIAILRALSHNISLLVLDEASVNLSANNRQWLVKIIKDFQDQGGAVVIVDHNNLAIDFTDEIFLLQHNKLHNVDYKGAALFLMRQNLQPYCHSFSPQITQDTLKATNITDEFIAKSQQNPLTFALKSGEIMGIRGDNGSGKSTLIEIICGIKKPAQGAVFWCEEELKKMRERKNLVTLITQESAQQFFTPGVRAELDLLQGSADQHLAHKLIPLFQLDKLFDRQIQSLSYGEKQRLAIVYGMLSNKKILVFDEPTYGMDNATYGFFTTACRFLTTLGKMLIIASHETQLLTDLADVVVDLSDDSKY